MADRPETTSRRIKLRQLNVLVAVAQWGSMAKAAEHLAISQPVVSKAIAELEQVLGVRLFDRVPSGVEPTPHGRALLKRSVAIFDDLRTSVSELETLSDPTAGELRIGCEEALSTGLLPTLIDGLTQRYPKLLFDVALGDPVTLQQRDLLNRRVELAIMRTAIADLDQALEASILCHDRMWVVAGINNPWARRRKVTLADLVSERWCLPPPDHPVGALVIEAFNSLGLKPPQRGVSVRSALCTSNLVAQDHYLGVLGDIFLHFNPPSVRLKVLPISFPVTAPPISVITLKGRTLSPAAQLFLDFTRRVITPLASKSRDSSTSR
jgi:DNA-binding transcriptional LysR family regulator